MNNFIFWMCNSFAWFSINITLLLNTCYVSGWFVRCWLVWSQYTIPSWTWESGSTPVRGWVGSHLFWPRTEACCHVHWFSSQIKKWQRSLARTEKNRLRLWKPSWSILIYVNSFYYLVSPSSEGLTIHLFNFMNKDCFSFSISTLKFVKHP